MDKNGTPLRVRGETAIRLQWLKYSEVLFERMVRKLTNLDFVALRRDDDKLIRALRSGAIFRPRIHRVKRYCYLAA